MKRQRCWGKPNLLRMPSEALKAAVQTIGRKVTSSRMFFCILTVLFVQSSAVSKKAPQVTEVHSAPYTQTVGPNSNIAPPPVPSKSEWKMFSCYFMCLCVLFFYSKAAAAAPPPPSLSVPPPSSNNMEAEMRRLEEEAAAQARNLDERARKLEEEQRALEKQLQETEESLRQGSRKLVFVRLFCIEVSPPHRHSSCSGKWKQRRRR